MKKKISVIVPAYNGENFISSCIDSVIDQLDFSMDDIEIIVLNDGSKDKTLDIANGYARRFPDSIKVIDQINMGTAKTRNKGISIAKGEYLMFIDQDDVIERRCIRNLYDTITANGGYEVVQSGFNLVDRTGRVVKSVLPVPTEFGKFMAIPAWAKLYATSFLKDNKIEFFSNNIGEDNVFTLEVIARASKYQITSTVTYRYSFDNDLNVTNTLHKKLSSSVDTVKLLDRMLDVTSSNEVKQEIFDYNILRTVAYLLLSYGRWVDRDVFMSNYREMFTWLDKSKPRIYQNRYIFRKPAGELMTVGLGIKCLILFHKMHAMKLFAIMYCKKGRA